MPAGTYNTKLDVGATYRLDVVWKDPAGAVRNNTGYTARMQMRKKYGSPVILAFTTTDGSITLGGVDGAIHIRGLATLTEAVTNRYGVYDLEMVAPSGDVDRILQGTVDFSPEVTK